MHRHRSASGNCSARTTQFRPGLPTWSPVQTSYASSGASIRASPTWPTGTYGSGLPNEPLERRAPTRWSATGSIATACAPPRAAYSRRSQGSIATRALRSTPGGARLVLSLARRRPAPGRTASGGRGHHSAGRRSLPLALGCIPSGTGVAGRRTCIGAWRRRVGRQSAACGARRLATTGSCPPDLPHLRKSVRDRPRPSSVGKQRLGILAPAALAPAYRRGHAYGTLAAGRGSRLRSIARSKKGRRIPL